MKKGERMLDIDKAILNLSKNRHMSPVKKIENRFDYILRENDLLYEDSIKFEISYNRLNGYYNIEIIPVRNNFDYQAYFMDNFQYDSGREKLDKFKKENNIGAIVLKSFKNEIVENLDDSVKY